MEELFEAFSLLTCGADERAEAPPLALTLYLGALRGALITAGEIQTACYQDIIDGTRNAGPDPQGGIHEAGLVIRDLEQCIAEAERIQRDRYGSQVY